MPDLTKKAELFLVKGLDAPRLLKAWRSRVRGFRPRLNWLRRDGAGAQKNYEAQKAGAAH